MFAVVRTFRSAIARSFHAGKVSRKKRDFPDPYIISTGKERFELMEHRKGNTDPFLLDYVKRGPGTRDCPNVILSAMSKRLVGCICHPDDNHITWFWLHECYPRRCNCNYWFVLERFEIPAIENPCDSS